MTINRVIAIRWMALLTAMIVLMDEVARRMIYALGLPKGGGVDNALSAGVGVLVLIFLFWGCVALMDRN